MKKTVEAKDIVFLLAEVARANFADAEERRWRVTEAFLLLAGKKKATQRDRAMVARELAK